MTTPSSYMRLLMVAVVSLVAGCEVNRPAATYHPEFRPERLDSIGVVVADVSGADVPTYLIRGVEDEFIYALTNAGYQTASRSDLSTLVRENYRRQDLPLGSEPDFRALLGTNDLLLVYITEWNASARHDRRIDPNAPGRAAINTRLVRGTDGLVLYTAMHRSRSETNLGSEIGSDLILRAARIVASKFPSRND